MGDGMGGPRTPVAVLEPVRSLLLSSPPHFSHRITRRLSSPIRHSFQPLPTPPLHLSQPPSQPSPSSPPSQPSPSDSASPSQPSPSPPPPHPHPSPHVHMPLISLLSVPSEGYLPQERDNDCEGFAIVVSLLLAGSLSPSLGVSLSLVTSLSLY